MKDSKGKHIIAVVMLKDVTELKRADGALNLYFMQSTVNREGG